MSYAQIKLYFEKYSNVGIENMLQTTIEATYSTPDVVDSCLVIGEGSSVTDEEILRVATEVEITSSPLDNLPATVTEFSSPSLSLITPTIGDVIRVTIPDLWQQFFSVGATEDYTVATVLSPTSVTVSPVFPAFGRGLTFEVLRSSVVILPVSGYPPVDGLANRDFSGISGPYLTNTHVDSWSDLTVAENRVTSLKAEASSLVDALNVSAWAFTEEVTYPS